MVATKVKVVFGAMTFGPEGTTGARVHNLEEQATMLDIFQAHGHNEIDTARMYSSGQCESVLAQNDWAGRGLVMGTKLYPNAAIVPSLASLIKIDVSYNHTPADVRRGLMDSLNALGTRKVDLFYLHGPDRKTPYEDTLREINKLHEEGYFDRFGVSNYMAWEVAQMCEICTRNNWIRPTVYQGVYHMLARKIEDELIPCLRAYELSFYAFAPLAGGLLTGKYTRDQRDFEAGSRFDPGASLSRTHRPRYWNDVYFDALAEVQNVASVHGLTLAEVSLRWLMWHSQLDKEKADAVIIGAGKEQHLEQNLVDLEKESLPKEVVEVVDGAYSKVKGVAPNYWH